MSFTTYLNHVSLSGLHLEMNMNKIGQFGLGGSQCGTSDGQSCRNLLSWLEDAHALPLALCWADLESYLGWDIRFSFVFVIMTCM